MPGDEVIISKAQPFLPVKVSKVVQYEDETPFKTEVTETKQKSFGYTKLLQKGENGVTKVTAEITMLDGVQVEKNIIARETIKEPVTEKILKGTKLPTGGYATGSTSGSGKFGWPLGGGKISCGWLGYRGHRAVDLVLYRNAPIYAADSGVVVKATKTGGGYGNHVIIDHGNGYTTLYAHMSRREVQYGQKVQKGQVIGYIGSTGNSSGPHLHFEIRYLGKPKNPMSFY